MKTEMQISSVALANSSDYQGRKWCKQRPMLPGMISSSTCPMPVSKSIDIGPRAVMAGMCAGSGLNAGGRRSGDGRVVGCDSCSGPKDWLEKEDFDHSMGKN